MAERSASTTLTDLAHGEPPGVDATDDEKGQYVFARWSAQNDHYSGFYRTWVKTVLFLCGFQHIKWLDNARRFVADTSVPPWRQLPVTNVVYAIYRTLEAKLTKQKPTLEVVPPSGDSDDRESANLAESILVHLWRVLKIPKRMRAGVGWFLCTGQVYLRTHWDPEAGKLVPLTTKAEVQHGDPELAAGGETEDVDVPCDDDGEPIEADEGDATARQGVDGRRYAMHAQPALVPQGECALSVEDPMSVRWNPEAIDGEDATEQYVAKLWTKPRALKHFGLEEQDLPSGDDDGTQQMYRDMLSSASAGAGWLGANNLLTTSLGASQEQALGDRVLVIEYYHAPDADNGFPKGRHWISIGTTKVWPAADDTDYPNGEAELPNGFWPPLVPVLSVPIPGQPQAMGPLPQVVGLNEALNTLDGQILEYEITQSFGGKWTVHPADEGLEITSDPAQVLVSEGYAAGKPPIQVKLEPLPAAIYAERTVVMDKVRLVMSLSEAETGQKPEGVSAGRAFLVLQEVTDSVLGPDLQAWEDAYEEMGRRLLVLAQAHYREPRTISIKGEEGKWQFRSFKGADLADGLDVRVQVGSSFPWSKSAQWDTKLSILSQFPELVRKPDGTIDRDAFSTFVDTAGTGLQAFESEEDPDLVEITREHAMFEGGEVPQIAFWQNHAKHLDGHFRFMKRDYGRYAQWPPKAQQAFLAHMQDTLKAVDELAQMAAEASQGPPPAMGGAGGGGAPPGGAPPNLQLMPGGGGRPEMTGPPGGQGPPVPEGQRPSLQPSDFRAMGG